MNEMLLLNKLDEDINWFKENQKRLEKEYDNNFIAISEEKVVVFDKNLDGLINKLKELKLDPSNMFIRFVSTTIIIL